jgi:thiol-disulfide isomerase/thioredoxin
MVLTESTMLPLETQAPHFDLEDVVTGNRVTLESFADKKALLVMFICRHCPYVKHIQAALAQLGRDYQNSDLGIVAISANNVETHPEDAPDSLREQAELAGFTFAYCYDESQEVAKAYTASCTPDFFLFDSGRRLVYRGQLDDSRPGNNLPVTGQDLRGAVEAVLKGQPTPAEQKPSIGCNIKWRPGNEPRYF